MIDDGELDWKVVAVRADDPLAESCADVSDVDRRVISGIVPAHHDYMCNALLAFS